MRSIGTGLRQKSEQWAGQWAKLFTKITGVKFTSSKHMFIPAFEYPDICARFYGEGAEFSVYKMRSVYSDIPDHKFTIEHTIDDNNIYLTLIIEDPIQNITDDFLKTQIEHLGNKYLSQKRAITPLDT